jgi:putative transposase
MGDVGACWDNAVVERFFGSIKHDWLFKVPQPTRSHMREDVARYMKYYNVERLHSANWINRQLNLKTPLEKCPVGVDQNTMTTRLTLFLLGKKIFICPQPNL